MSTSIEDKVVSLKFDNVQFSKGVGESQKSLEQLNKALQMKNGTKGLDDIESRASRFNLSALAEAPGAVAEKFSLLATTAAVALGNIASQAISTGATLLNSFTMQPIMDGFGEYETKMGSIQTILANTASKGTTLDQVTSALDTLNTYADKTIYNFAEMTHNIGLFTNAGLGVEESASMIKGFSNAAAASGTTSSAAANAAYQLSQALSAGTIKLMDWRSLTNAGMGNKNMQEGLVQIAEAMGTLSASGTSAEKVQANFNDSLSKGWLTADVMSKYLQIMAGDIDAAAMAEMGLTDAQIEQFQVQQKNAEEAATKVRTFTQLIGTIQETLGSGWAKTFEILLGNFDEASELFTNINNVISPMIDGMSDARNALLQGWADLGGRKDIIDGLASAFNSVSSIIGTIGKAFRDIFPPIAAENLKSISEGFKNFMKALEPSEESLKRLGIVAKTVFAFLKVFVDTVSAGFRVMSAGVSRALQTVRKALDMLPVGSVIDSLDGVGEKLASWTGIADVAAKSIEQINKFFDFLDQQLEHLKPTITEAVKEFMAFFKTWTAGLSGADGGEGFASKWKSTLEKIKNYLSEAKTAIENFFKAHYNPKALTNISDSIKAAFTKLFDWLKSLSFMDVLKTVFATGGISAIVVGLVKGFDAFMNVAQAFTRVGNGLAGLLDGVRDVLKAYETDIKAEAIKKIAISILILAGALFVLSLLPLASLATAVGAMGVSLAALVGGLYAMDKYTKDPKKVLAMAASMVLMAAAVGLMAVAAKYLTDVPIEQLGAATGAVTVLLIAMTGMTRVLSGAGKGATKHVLIMLGMAVAVYILAKAVARIADIPINQMAVAGGVIAGLTVALGLMGALVGHTKAKAGPLLGMVGVAIAVYILAKAVVKLGTLEQKQLEQGVLATLVVMLAMAVFSELSKSKSVNAGVVLSYIAAALLVAAIGYVISKLAALPMDKLIAGTAVIGLIMLGMAALLKASQKEEGVKIAFKAGVFLAIGKAINSVANSIIALGSLDTGALIQGGVAIALVMAAMFALSIGMTKLTNVEQLAVVAGSYIALSSAMYTVALAIAKVAEVPLEGVVTAVIALLVTMAALTAIANLAEGSVAGAAAMLLLSIGVIALAVGLGMLAAIGLVGLVVGIIALAIGLGVLIIAGYLAEGAALGLVILTAAIMAIGLACLLAGVGVMALGVGMGMLVTALVASSAVAWSSIGKMTVALLAFGVAGLIAAPAALALGAGLLMMGAGLLMAGIGMRIMTGAIKPFIQAINQADQIGVVATTKLTAAIAAIGGAATLAAPGMMMFGVGIALVGVGLLAFAIGGAAASATAALMGTAFGAGIDKVNAALTRMAPVVTQFAASATTLMTSASTLGTTVTTAFMGISMAIASCIPLILMSCVMFQMLGSDVVTNIVTGLQTATPQINVAITTLVMTMFTTFIGRMALGQPMVYAGMMALANHISLAITRISSMVRIAINMLVMDMLSTLSNGLSNLSNSVYSSAMQTGYWMAEGLRVGFTNQRGALVEMARSTAAAMLAAANAELKVNSPSKKFKETGHWAAKGLEIGWTDTAVKAVDAVTRTAEEFEEAFRDIISSIDMDEISDDINPVITPVLDLSEAKAGADDLRSMFGNEAFRGVQNAASGIGARSSEESSQNGSQKTVVFNQYNNSPKALNEVEIYRQTKSSISRIARV